MTFEELIAAINRLAAERDNLWEQKKPIDRRLVQIGEEISKLSEQRDICLYEDRPLDWSTIPKTLGGSGGGSMYLHRRVEKELSERFDMHRSGYWVDTLEVNFEVKVEHKTESVEKNVAGVKFLTPFLTPHEEDGRIWFGVFENSLSANGSFTLRALPDLSKLWLHRRFMRDVEFDSVEEAIQYIHDYHWYGPPYNEE